MAHRLNGAGIKHQRGVIAVSTAVILGGMLSFFSVVLLVIVASTTDSRLSMLADAVLYSASGSQQAAHDANQILHANLEAPNLGLTQPALRLNPTETDSHTTLSGVVDRRNLVLTDALGSDDLVITHQAQSRVSQTTLEIVVMLDVSNSMKGQPMSQATKGLRDFADVLYAQERRSYNKVISIVPATGLVNIGWRPHFFKASALTIPRGLRPLAKEQAWQDLLNDRVPGRWRQAMCTELPEIVDRLNNASSVTSDWVRQLELPPSQQAFRFHLNLRKPAIDTYENGAPLHSYYYSANKDPYNEHWKHQQALFDAEDCGVSKVQPLLSTHAEFVKALDTLHPEFNTNNAEGVMWAWRLLSPKWRGWWDKKKVELPRDYGLTSNRKVLLLFTDGNHLIDVTKRDRKQVALCREMKRQGIEVIAIDFNNRSQALQSCASPGQYYPANNRTIRTVLKQVATTLNKIELVE